MPVASATQSGTDSLTALKFVRGTNLDAVIRLFLAHSKPTTSFLQSDLSPKERNNYS
jgi:hypothetical protein